jgi:hypothetical protein
MSGSNLPGINYEKYPLLKGDKFLQEAHLRKEWGMPNIAWGNLANLDTRALAELGRHGAWVERYERYPHRSSPSSGMTKEEKQKYYKAISEEKRAIKRKAFEDWRRRYPGGDLMKFLALEQQIEAEHAAVRASRRKEARKAKQRAKTARRSSSSGKRATRKSRQ